MNKIPTNYLENKKQENFEWFKKFVEIAKKHNIWYTVTNGTLLGAIREKGPIKWDDDFDVMMTPSSYAKLKKLFPNNCLDGTVETTYPLVIPKFVPNIEKFLKSSIFVDIFIVVPTNNKKVRNFRKLTRKMNFSMQAVHSTWVPYAWYIWLWKYLSWPFKFLTRKLTYKKAIEILSVRNDKFTYYYSIDNPVDPKKSNIIDILSFLTYDWDFGDIKVRVPVEYDAILKRKYNNYMIPNEWQRPFIHVNAVSIEKIKKNKKKI